LADPLNLALPEHVTTYAADGRIEVQRHRVSHDIGWMLSDRHHPGEAIMPGLAMIGMAEAVVTRDGRTSTTQRIYLSPAQMGARRIA